MIMELKIHPTTYPCIKKCGLIVEQAPPISKGITLSSIDTPSIILMILINIFIRA